ncbi:DUF4214 domain-containing protein [uncultured Massilia sp.]|uniref:DUF4214 domain-containing protein n=1 Tax=uncultured Massilia sp. TaxID=169973 RepID=UPI0025EC8818|nr:DUF4214 domain-containing protein [uncultured Massilia sp.]
MAGQYDATVTAFYLAYYGRPADPAGLAFWSQALEDSDGDFSAIVDAFSTSTEATDHFGTGTPAERVTAIYQQLFSRAPDQAGLDYWLGALEKGNVNLGDIAIQIVGGAQDQDLALSTLRQEVAAQFTAAVTASGVAYDGDAAIEAARVLMAAVTTATGADQVKSLVAASTALVQTAHDNPAIISTLAADGKLSAVLATTSGQADPVGAINALTSIAKAAAGDPAALATLQQGGGVTGLLNSLPAGTSLANLGAAVDKGGLGAAIEITKPPVATVPEEPPPPSAPRVRLVEDTGIDATDKVTANGKLQVSGVEDGATWQYSADNGKTWTTGAAAVGGVATLDTSGTGAHALLFRTVSADGASDVTAFHYTIAPTIAFSGPDGKDLPTDTLTANSLYFFVHVAGRAAGTQAQFQVSATGKDGSWSTADESVQLPDGQYYIRYLVTDTDGKVSPTNALKLIMDQSKPSPTVELVEDTGLSATDKITKNGQVKIGGLGAGETWAYSFDNGKTWTKGTTGSDGTAIVDAGSAGAQSLLVRTYDKADGNAFTNTQFKYTVQAPLAPTMAFAGVDGTDSGSDTLTVNSTDYVVNVYGSKTSVSHEFQVSDTGKDGSWVSTSDSTLLPDGLHYIRYVFTDAAGNVGATNALKLVVDTVAPAQA